MFNVTHIAVILLKLLSSQISKLCKMQTSEKLVKIQNKKLNLIITLIKTIFSLIIVSCHLTILMLFYKL